MLRRVRHKTQWNIGSLDLSPLVSQLPPPHLGSARSPQGSARFPTLPVPFHNALRSQNATRVVTGACVLSGAPPPRFAVANIASGLGSIAAGLGSISQPNSEPIFGAAGGMNFLIDMLQMPDVLVQKQVDAAPSMLSQYHVYDM